MLYLTNRFNTSNNVLNVNSLKSARGCVPSQNSWSGFLGIVEKKLKLRNSQKTCCTAPGGTRKALNRVGKQTIKTFLSCYSFLNSRSVIFSPTSLCPMSAVVNGGGRVVMKPLMVITAAALVKEMHCLCSKAAVVIGAVTLVIRLLIVAMQ